MARKVKKAARKGRNPNDATFRNINALKKRVELLEKKDKLIGRWMAESLSIFKALTDQMMEVDRYLSSRD